MKNTTLSHLCPRAGRRLKKKDNYIITENWKKGKVFYMDIRKEMVQSLYDLLTDNELDKNLLESSEKLKICVMSIFRKRELMIIRTHYVISSILHFLRNEYGA